jgi:trk system potassium uptake protein TrkH
MLLRPSGRDVQTIVFYAGRVVFGVGLAMLLPAGLAVALGETDAFHGLLIGAALAVIAGQCTSLLLPKPSRLSSTQGLAAVGLAWIAAPFFAAVPLVLSGHYAGWLDAYFESMSGFATIGLTLVNDLDHLARSVNLWRHLMQFIGGQGIIIVALSIFANAGVRAGSLYSGEGREEKILPSVVHTARFIWRVALGYGFLGTTLLWAAMLAEGMPPGLGLYHAINVFMAAFDTGGFGVMSTSAAYYRSPIVEAVLLVVMTAGAFSFALHYQLWQGRKSELLRNLETRTVAVTTLGILTVMVVGLARAGTLVDFGPLFRHAMFQTISAHTTTGLATVPGRLYVTDWGEMAPAMLVFAMAIGGMAGSTAGGIKAMRVGLLVKGLRNDIRKVLLPEHAVVIETYHSTTKRVLRSEQVSSAVVFFLLWLGLYGVGSLVGLVYGYDLRHAIFESTAAASSGGLSVGVVRPDLEVPLKLVYVAQMVVGRLEFVSLFALAGYFVAAVRGRA